MNRHTIRSGAFVALLLSLTTLEAAAQDKPLLSAEIRTAWERGGTEAAQLRFNEIVPGQTDQYVLDLEGFAALAQEVVEGGDSESLMAFSMMMSTLAVQMMGSVPGGGPGGMPGGIPDMAAMAAQDEAMRQRQSEERAAERAAAEASAAEERRARVLRVMGTPRDMDDLERFVGQYGPPDKQETPRWNLFATVRCDGYLVVGAMGGDASDWHMRSLSDLVFETEMFGGDTLTISFAMDAGGSPASMTHTLESFDPTLPYVGPLPAEWAAVGCVRPPGG